jgi:hypothetical protein
MNLRVTVQNEFRDAKHKVTEPKFSLPWRTKLAAGVSTCQSTIPAINANQL